MALQLGALRDPLIDAGAGPDKASKAAEELAGYDHAFSGLRADVTELRTDMNAEFVKVRVDLGTEIANARADLGADLGADIADLGAEVRVLKWGQGVTVAAVLAMLLKLFLH